MIEKEGGTTSKFRKVLKESTNLSDAEARKLKRLETLSDGQLFEIKKILVDPFLKHIKRSPLNQQPNFGFFSALETLWQVDDVEVKLYVVTETFVLEKEECWSLPQCIPLNKEIPQRKVIKGSIVFVRIDHKRKAVEIEGHFKDHKRGSGLKTHHVFEVDYVKFNSTYRKYLKEKS